MKPRSPRLARRQQADESLWSVQRCERCEGYWIDRRFAGLAVCLFVLVACVYVRESAGCTVFLAARDNIVLGGNNEDWHVPLTKLWFLPAQEGRHGVVYVTFGNHRAIQGGMNDQGLFFDFLAVKPREVKATVGKPRWNGHPLREVMERCATVDEAIAMLERHPRAFMRRICIFLGDGDGNAAIVEAEAVVRKQGEYHISTNFRQSLVPPEKATCRRYRTADRMLSQAKEFNVDLFKRICGAVHQEGKNATLYSTVYDLKNKVLYLYHFHDYENVVVFDLKKELAKGERVVDMPDLFPEKPAFRRFQRQATKQAAPRSSDRAPQDAAPQKTRDGGS